jgi:hypothetical protein
MQNVFGTPVSNSNKLNCTANDIRLSKAIEVSPTSCIEGSTFNLTATFETIVTANSRYDGGFFFRIDGGANARGDGTGATGICSLSGLDPGVAPAMNLDGDTCGDLNAGTYNVTFTIPGVLCKDTNGDGFLNLPNCTSWHSNQGTACNIGTAEDFHPDTKSKCVCDDTFQVPVIVETASLSVVKTAAPTSEPETGGAVTYTAQITNDATYVSVKIDTIMDDIYGDLSKLQDCGTGEPNAITPGPCTPASVTSCPSLIGVTLAPGGSTSCKFAAFVSGDAGEVIKDIIEACGTDSSTHKVCGHDDANVTITDVSATPSLNKDAQSATCSVDVTYQVVVSNNSTIDTLTVDTLTDNKFGDITTVHGASAGPPAVEQVVSTSCATGGTIATSGNYTCSFVGRVSGSSCNFTHTDIVTGNVTDDDGVKSSPSDNASVTVGITGLTP